jgi:hypothetical protein
VHDGYVGQDQAREAYDEAIGYPCTARSA